VALAAFLVVGSFPVLAEGVPVVKVKFDIVLTGAAERPTPVATEATGTADVQFEMMDGAVKWLKFDVEVCDIVNVTVSHIHAPAGENATAPAVLFLYEPGALVTTDRCVRLTSGKLSGERLQENLFNIELGPFVDALMSGHAYINVHTKVNPAGAIRGQLQ
jgi:hypothetical protein